MEYNEKRMSFTNMLNSEYDLCDELPPYSPDFIPPQNHDTQASEGVSCIQSQVSKDKRTRTKNFTRQEDEMLISAWQNISMDPITGVDQTSGSYWQRVHNYFMKYKDFQSDRSWGSLMHRWSVIQLTVNKFQGFYNQVGVRSGYSEDDKIRDAKDMYKELYKTNFSLDHCWKVLRNLPKWNASFATKKSKNSQKDSLLASSPGTPECVTLGVPEFERPIGRKAAKELEKKRKRLGSEHDDDGPVILQQMRADQLESRKQRSEHLKEMIQLAKERAEREKERDEREKIRQIHEQDEADARIMAVDMSSMGAIEIEYFNSRKKEIIERIRKRCVS